MTYLFFCRVPFHLGCLWQPEGSISFHINLGTRREKGSRALQCVVGWILLIFGQEKMSILRSKCDGSNFSWDHLCGLADQRMVQLNWLQHRQTERGSDWVKQLKKDIRPQSSTWNLKMFCFSKLESPGFQGLIFRWTTLNLKETSSWHFETPRLWRLPVPFLGFARRIYGGSTCEVWRMADEGIDKR